MRFSRLFPAPRALVGLLMAGLLAVTALGAGQARGQAQAAGTLVICSGHGITTIQVDVNGTPVGRQVLCPDCALTLLADIPVPPLPVRLAHPGRMARTACVRRRRAPARYVPLPPSRGPPSTS